MCGTGFSLFDRESVGGGERAASLGNWGSSPSLSTDSCGLGDLSVATCKVEGGQVTLKLFLWFDVLSGVNIRHWGSWNEGIHGPGHLQGDLVTP